MSVEASEEVAASRPSATSQPQCTAAERTWSLRKDVRALVGPWSSQLRPARAVAHGDPLDVDFARLALGGGRTLAWHVVDAHDALAEQDALRSNSDDSAEDGAVASSQCETTVAWADRYQAARVPTRSESSALDASSNLWPRDGSEYSKAAVENDK